MSSNWSRQIFLTGTNGDVSTEGLFPEVFTTKTEPVPAFSANITPTATFALTPAADSKEFLVVDVTDAVKFWLANPTKEFGFGISGDSTISTLIGSKEGTGSGYPPVLEVDVNDSASGTVAGSSAVFSGNVGIGTTTPVASLDINPPSGADVLGFHQSSNGSFSIDSVVAEGGRFIVATNGNIGMGEGPFIDTRVQPGENPIAKIQLLTTGGALFGDNDNAALGLDSGQGGARLGFLKQSGTGPVMASSSGNPIIFSQSDQNSIFDNIATATVTERMRIDSNGRVGIGTNAPMHKLDVNGNLFMGTQANGQVFTELADTIYLGSGRKYLSNTLGAQVNNNTDWLNLMCHPLSSGIIFGTSGPTDTDPHSAPNPLMVIQSGGKVGIGTTTPGALLDVAGDILENGKSVPEAEEKLRIVRGSVLGDGTIKTGTGFTITHTASTGAYTVHFGTAFTGVGPTVTASILQPSGALTAVIPTISTTSCVVDTFNGATASDLVFSFIAIGTR